MSRKHYVVPESKPALREVLDQLLEPEAVLEGRVFKNGIRVSDADTALTPKDVIEVWARRADAPENVSILAFQSGFLVADKPAALSTTPDHRGTHSLVSEVEAWLGAHAPEHVGDAHPVSRLDVGVSGAVLFALTSEARKSIENASSGHELLKRYVGIVRGQLSGEGVLEGAIGHAQKRGRSRPAIRSEGKPSRSKYRVLGHGREATLLELEPLTGRTHQLRLHLAERGSPLFGDRTHGGSARITSITGSVRELDRIMLHAESVTLSVEGTLLLRATSSVPPSMVELWSLLDGDPHAWNALAAPR